MRYGRTYHKGIMNYSTYNTHICGTMLYDEGNGSNAVMVFGFNLENGVVYYSFGGGTAQWEDRVTAAPIRCVRDE